MKKIACLAVTVLLLWSCTSQKQHDHDIIHYEKPITFDFRKLKQEAPRDMPGMNSISPGGDTINVNSHYISINSEPWIPSYAEFNYQRYPEAYWEEALLKLKSQGLQGVSSYVFWIGHEEVEGQWNFSGNKNLRKFIQLCAKHDMLFFARIGPWVNGEIKGGGHPDWLVERLGDPNNPHGHGGSGGKLRSMAPEYLAAVDKLYQKLAEQMEGLYWKDGGPIFAIQLDNEYTPAHSGIGGTKLIEWEKETALKYGMEVPLYTTTGWNKAEFIQDHTIQVHGSYADYYWSRAQDYYRTPAFSFSTLRAVDGIDTEVNHFDSESSTDIEKYTSNPYLTCETGIGMHLAYHCRPQVNHLDNGAVSLVELGSGCNGMGYFMGIGGNTPVDRSGYLNRDFTQTSIETPKISNDYQSAIGEFGQIRQSFHEYPIQLHFMKDFGKYLAPCLAYISPETDELRGVDINISTELQRAVRSDGESGFIFVNNHVKHDTSIQFNNVQFVIKLEEETLTIPEQAVDIPVDAYFYWPFNLTLPGAKIKYATAQPVLHLEGSNTYVFFQNEGISAEFVFDNSNIETIHCNNAKIIEKESVTRVEITHAGHECYVDIRSHDGNDVRFLVLNQAQAKQLYRSNDKIYLSDAEVLLFEGDELRVISEKTENAVWVYPENTVEHISTHKDGLFAKFEVDFEKVEVPLTYEEVQDGKGLKFKNRTYYNQEDSNVGVPDDSIFEQGTIVSMHFPEGIPTDLYDVRVIVDYRASALRLFKNDEFIYDDFYNGDVWVYSTKRLIPDYNTNMKLELKFIPLQPLDAINVAGHFWPDLKHVENVLEVNAVTTVPVYVKTLTIR